MDEKLQTPEESQEPTSDVIYELPAAELPAAELPAAELPLDNPNLPPPDKSAKVGIFRQAVRVALHRIIPTSLILTAAFVYAVLTISALLDSDVSGNLITRMLLGEFTGGAENVKYTETSSSASLDSVSDENTVTIPPQPQPQPVTAPTETSADQEPEITESPIPSFPVTLLDMSSKSENALGIINETPYDVDLNALLSADRAIPKHSELVKKHGNDAPLVLILHTHTTEAFADTYDADFRTLDTSKNITEVGKVVADKLTECGISVIHCTEVFDYPDFNMAYYNAALCIKKHLAEYPSISYIIDIHRDSIVSGEKYVNPATSINGSQAAHSQAAQMMFVVGTDHGGSGHVGWRDNLALAARIQKSIADEYPTLPRDINLRSASFNEQYTAGSLLLEIGSSASTLSEAKLTAQIFATHLSAEITGN